VVQTALKHIFSFRGAPGAVRVQRLLSKLSTSGTKVPPTFYKQFQRTESLFFHHIVFNVTTQTCEFLVDEASANCHADVFARVKEAMGISTSHACLHSIPAPATSSFMGTVPPRDVMIAVFNGEKCSRTKQTLAEAPSPTYQPFNSHSEAVDDLEHSAPVDVGDLLVDEADLALLDTLPKKRPVRKPVIIVDPAAEERKRLQLEQLRDATMRSLRNTYSSNRSSTVSFTMRDPDTRPDLSIELIAKVSSAPTRHLPSTKRTHDGAFAPPSTVSSMKELAQRHARDSETASTSATTKSTVSLFMQSAAGAKKTPQKTPESAKKRKVLSGATPPSAHKNTAAPASSSLLYFFRKA
jgi:hypothetical protein